MLERQSPLSFQYLGESRVPFSCIAALITVVTSPYRPRTITVVFCEMQRGQDSTDACFLVWDWFAHDATIIADGFGTHPGISSRGLALALGLITFYHLPLHESWVEREQFKRIASGHPTAYDLEHVSSTESRTPHWPDFLPEDGISVWSHMQLPTLPIPYWLLEPEVMDDLKDIERDPGSAVFRVARRLEIFLRTMGQFPAHLLGQDLINQAVSPGKPFAPKTTTASESEAWASLFRGVIGAFKNPESHRDQQLPLYDAIIQILTINLLVRKLKADFPDQFPKKG